MWIRRVAGLLFLTAVGLATSPSQVSIVIPPGDTLRGRPGTVLALPVRLTNTGEVPVTATPGILLPSTWRMLSTVPAVTVPADSFFLVIPMVSVPSHARGGLYRIDVRFDQGGPEPVVKRIAVRIASLISIEGSVLDAPRFAVAGSEINAAYLLRNTGNDSALVIVDATSSLGYPVIADAGMISVPPGGTVSIAVRVQTPADERQRRQHSLVLTARTVPDEKLVTLATITDIVPQATSSGPERNSFPVFATLRGTQEEGRRGLQAEVVGAGPFSENGSDRMEVLVRGPETRTISPLGLQDEYRARYTDGGTSLYVGDWNYVLTPLTEVGRYATGAGGYTGFGDLSFGGFVNRTRIGTPARGQTAGWVRYGIADGTDVGVNVLNATGPRAGNVVTVLGSATPFENSALELEAGSSGGGSDAHAYAVRFRGALPWGVYDIRTVGAGSGYLGYYRDIRFSSVSLTGFATRAIRTEFSARTERRNPGADTLRGGSPTTGFVQVGAGYYNYLTISYRMSGNSDPYALAPYDRREDIVQVRSALSLPFVSLSAYVDIGSLTDKTINATSPSTRYALSASTSALPRQSYNASVELVQNRDILTGQRTERLALSIGGNVVITERTRADINAYASRISGLDVRYALLDASVEHVFPFAHRAAVRFRRSEFSGVAASNAVSLEYGLPLAVPLGVKSGVGVIRGRVTDASGKGLRDVLVSAGTAASITDGDGAYIIPGLSPGAHFLAVDRATIGLDRITTVPLPLEVEVRGGEEAVIPITVIPSASLRGRIVAFDLDPSMPADSFALVPKPVDASLVLLVELTNGSEFQRRRTDSRGTFSFMDLRPGTWSMKVTPLSLPPDDVIDVPPPTIEVAMGSALERNIRVLPKRRTIRIVQEGGILGAPPPPEEDTEIRYEKYIIRKSPARGGYYVQTSAFAVEDLANVEARRLERVTGRKASVTPTESPEGTDYYRVEFGPFETSSAAKVFCDSLPE